MEGRELDKDYVALMGHIPGGERNHASSSQKDPQESQVCRSRPVCIFPCTVVFSVHIRTIMAEGEAKEDGADAPAAAKSFSLACSWSSGCRLETASSCPFVRPDTPFSFLTSLSSCGASTPCFNSKTDF